MDINLARILANIASRAVTLFTEQGYTMEEDDTFDGFFTVTKPNGDTYLVIHDGFKKSCSCEAYKQYETCKHFLAVADELEQRRAMCEAYEREQAEAETADGVDYPDGPLAVGGCPW